MVGAANLVAVLWHADVLGFLASAWFPEEVSCIHMH